MEFFDLQLFIMPKKLGFYYKGRLPWRMQRYGICDVQEQAETKIVCRIGTAEDKIDTKREKFDAILSRAGGVELSIIKAKKNRVFDVWLKVGSGGKEEKNSRCVTKTGNYAFDCKEIDTSSSEICSGGKEYGIIDSIKNSDFS